MLFQPHGHGRHAVLGACRGTSAVAVATHTRLIFQPPGRTIARSRSDQSCSRVAISPSHPSPPNMPGPSDFESRGTRVRTACTTKRPGVMSGRVLWCRHTVRRRLWMATRKAAGRESEKGHKAPVSLTGQQTRFSSTTRQWSHAGSQGRRCGGGRNTAQSRLVTAAAKEGLSRRLSVSHLRGVARICAGWPSTCQRRYGWCLVVLSTPGPISSRRRHVKIKASPGEDRRRQSGQVPLRNKREAPELKTLKTTRKGGCIRVAKRGRWTPVRNPVDFFPSC